MSVIILASVLLRLLATTWSVVLVRRMSDRRILLLTAMLAMMSCRQLWTLAERYEPESLTLFSMTAELNELPGLIVSLMALLLVFNLEGLFSSFRQVKLQPEANHHLPIRPALAIGLGSVLGIAGVAYLAYENSRNAIRRTVASENLALGRMICNFAVRDLDRTGQLDRQLAFDRVRELWSQARAPYPNSSMCVIDRSGKIRVHTTKPEMEGVDVGRVTISNSRGQTIAGLLDSQQSWSGQTANLRGIQELVSYHYDPDLASLVVVHVPTQVADNGFQAAVAPWIMSMLLIGGLVLPCSLIMLFHSSRRSNAEVQKSLAALSRSEQRFRLLVNTLPNGVEETNLQGQIVFCNPAYAQMHGCREEEVLGRYIWDFEITPEKQERLKSYYHELMESSPFCVPYETTIRTMDGRLIDIRVNYSYRKDAQGRLVGCTSIISDITESKRASEAVRMSEERHRGFVENSTEGIYLCELHPPLPLDLPEGELIERLSRQCSIAVCNDAFARMHGYASGHEMVARQESETVVPLVRGTRAALFRNLVRNRFQLTEDISDEFDSGNQRVVYANTCLGIIENDSVTRIWGTRPNITERTIAQQQLAESEQRYRQLVENSPFCIHEIELDGRLSSLNSAGLTMFGLGAESEACGAAFLNLVGQADRTRIGELFRQACSGHTHHFEFESIAGKRLRSCFVPLTASDGRPQRIMGLTQDITEHYLSQQLIRSQNEVFEAIATGLSQQATLTRLTKCIESLSADLFASVLILDETGTRLRHASAPSLPSQFIEAIDGLEIGPAVGSCGTAAFRGEPVFVDDIAADPRWERAWELAATHQLRACWSTPIKDSLGSVLGTFAIYRRQTGSPTPHQRRLIETFTHLAALTISRHRAEAALRQSEANFRTIFEQAAVGVALLDSFSGKILQVNSRYGELLGRSTDDLIGVTWMDLTHPDDLERDLENMRRLRAGEITQFAIEKRIQRRDGTFIWIDLSVAPMWRPGDEPTKHVAIVEDITDRKISERALAFQADVLKRVSDAVLVTDAAGVVTYANEAADRLFQGIKKHRDAPSFRALHQKLFSPGLHNKAVRSGLSERGQWHGECEFVVDQEIRHVEIKLKRFQPSHSDEQCLLFVVRDVTARTKAEQEIRQHRAMLAHVTRLSTMGELIAGIAHEVKQPLYAISNFTTATSVLLRNLAQTEYADQHWLAELQEWNEDTRQASQRASEIIQRLRNFSRKGEQKRENIDVNQAIRDSIELVAFEARQSGTTVETHLDETLPEVAANRIQCEQIMVNLLHNAYEALAGTQAQPQVVIRSSRKDDFVEICVQDNGPGIPADRHGKLFEAFFTTKSNGLGLGLAISRTIVEDHGGRLWTETSETKGAAFHFTLPIAVKPALKC